MLDVAMHIFYKLWPMALNMLRLPSCAKPATYQKCRRHAYHVEKSGRLAFE